MSVMTLVQQLAVQLLERQWYLVTTESCTGGLLAAACTELAGSSQWFERGFVTYSNAAKQSNLQVRANTLEKYGAVSTQTAIEMAHGALAEVPTAQIAVSTTGIAGPEGATPHKPVGLVCFAVAVRGAEGVDEYAYQQVFVGDRHQIRQQAVQFALQRLLQHSTVTP